MRRTSSLLLTLFAGACVVYAVTVAPLRPWPHLVSTLPDDAAYYFQIGRNYADGLGLTFDGRNRTNGFQPFWQAIIAFMQRVLPFHSEQFVRAVLFIQAVLLTAALVVFNRTLRFLDNPLLRLIGTVLFLATTYLMVRDGMESALLILLAVMAVYFHASYGELDRWNIGQRIGFGILMGCILLARLDSIFWVIGIFAVLVLMTSDGRRTPPITRIRRALWIAGPCAALLAPYLASNYLSFKHVMPISGALKSSFPTPGFYAPAFSLSPDTWALLLLAVMLAVVCLVWELGPWSRGPAWPLRGPACAISIGVLLHFGYAVLFMKWAVFSWHFALERFAVCILVPYLGAKLALLSISPILQRWAIGAMAVILACTAPLLVMKRDWDADRSRSWKWTSYEAAQWVKANLPRDAVLAMKDAGNMGFYSERPVVNLDGLVNSFDYQKALREGRFREFLRNSGVNYFVQHAFWNDPQVNIEITEGTYEDYTFRSYSRLYDQPGGELRLRRSDEVYRSLPYFDGSNRTVLVIWRVAPADLS